MGNNFQKQNKTENSKKYFLNHNLYYHLRYLVKVYSTKYPILIEDYLGIDMRWTLMKFSVAHASSKYYYFRLQIDAKNLVTERDDDVLISWFENDYLRVDDIIDLMAGHRFVHQAVLFDDEDIVDYLIKNDAHLMARDWNGYTPLLKAASLGRFNIVKKLVDAGVPPFHKDPWGKTPLDKAELYGHHEIINYLKSLPVDLNNEKIELWKKKNFKEKFDLTPLFMRQF